MMDEQRDKHESRWFPEPATEVNVSVRQVVSDHERYIRDKLSKTGETGKRELYRILQAKEGAKKAESGQKRENEGSLIEMLHAMPLEVLSRYVSAESESLRASKSNLDDKRTKGVRRVYAKTEQFISEFDRFLSAYSGIVNILATADSQYGGVATATLALLFSIAKMKMNDEEAIVSAMREVSDRLPDFRTYQKIYPNPELGQMLADAYRDVILLAREATTYFQYSTFRRHVSSIGRPAEFAIMGQRMRDNFSRIRLKCETLLAQRVDDLVEKLEGEQQRNDWTHVAVLRNALALDNYPYDKAKENLTGYREYLEARFDKDRHRQKLSLSDFLDTCQCWTTDGSVVLLLFGSNEIGIASVSESWLSPVAVDMTQELLQRGRLVAFEMCDEHITCDQVLARLVYQLLEANPKAVREPEDWQALEKHIVGRKVDRIEGLKSALRTIIDLQKEPVYIVLNRPELNQDEDAGEYITIMLNLAKETKGGLKVLMVQRAELWDIDENRRGVVPRGLENLLQTVRLDQHRI